MSVDDRLKKNQVFGGSDIAAGMPTSNVVADDFGWEVPVETVPVPSEGKTYPPGSSLHGLKTIDIRAMTAREEDILTSRALIKKGTVITHLLNSCVVDKSIKVENMLSGDRNALMVAVRITGYGTSYRVDVTCPECNERSNQDLSLGDLPIKRLQIDPVEIGKNLFSYTLPVTGKEVYFRFLTGNDEEEMSVTAERKRKMMPDSHSDSLVTSRLEKSIVSIDGVSDRSKVNAFIRSMPAQDSRKLRNYIEENEPGIEMKIWMGCPRCSEDSKVQLPLSSGFFWPRD